METYFMKILQRHARHGRTIAKSISMTIHHNPKAPICTELQNQQQSLLFREGCVLQGFTNWGGGQCTGCTNKQPS